MNLKFKEYFEQQINTNNQQNNQNNNQQNNQNNNQQNNQQNNQNNKPALTQQQVNNVIRGLYPRLNASEKQVLGPVINSMDPNLFRTLSTSNNNTNNTNNNTNNTNNNTNLPPGQTTNR